MRNKIEKILKEYKNYETGGLTHATNELLDLFDASSRRELLIAFQKFIQTKQAIYFLHPEKNADDFLKAINYH